MEEADFAVWRRHLRQVFFEQLVIQNAFSVQLLAGRLSVDEAEQSIKEGLDVTSARSDALFGDLLRDPALTALYADEVKGVLDQIKERVAHYASHLRESDS
jgi:hypothetical protein